MNLLPYPRSLKLQRGTLALPKRGVVAATKIVRSKSAPNHAEGYSLSINKDGIKIGYREIPGLRAARATLKQILREHGRTLPFLKIRDWPDFPRRGVMLDVSRGRVPKLETLLELVEHLAEFKINEFQLYTEHTFAYKNYKPVWKKWGALTAAETRKLDARCRELGIDLVPNQNSFGHLRYWLEHPPLKKLGEVSEPYVGATGDFLRYPTTLAPNNPGTISFLRKLYDELLPNFSSKFFNVGCDETWDLGRGQSKELCERFGKGRVYLDFLLKIHREAKKRGRKMMFWGDIILHHPELIKKLPRDAIALNWGYEANHPFDCETAIFSKSKIPFYVCPGTSTWMTLIGRHDTAFANLQQAAKAGHKHGALGYLNTDWGDGGHPQPLAVSWLPFLFGAAVSWCEKSFDEKKLVPVLSRDVFDDPTENGAVAALMLGLIHLNFAYIEANVTPFGAVIAAPPPESRELFCRNGLKHYARISEGNIRRALKDVGQQRKLLSLARPRNQTGKVLVQELDLAAQMAAHSCKYMLWQKALAAGKNSLAKKIARQNIRELQKLDRDFKSYWRMRNKGSTETCSKFLQWRIEDYRRGVLHYSPDGARAPQKKITAAE